MSHEYGSGERAFSIVTCNTHFRKVAVTRSVSLVQNSKACLCCATFLQGMAAKQHHQAQPLTASVPTCAQQGWSSFRFSESAVDSGSHLVASKIRAITPSSHAQRPAWLALLCADSCPLTSSLPLRKRAFCAHGLAIGVFYPNERWQMINDRNRTAVNLTSTIRSRKQPALAAHKQLMPASGQFPTGCR